MDSFVAGASKTQGGNFTSLYYKNRVLMKGKEDKEFVTNNKYAKIPKILITSKNTEVY